MDMPLKNVCTAQPRRGLPRSGFYSFLCAGLIIAAATLLRMPLQQGLGEASPFLFYWPSVLAVAVLFGLKPALAAIGVAVLLANYLWMPPYRAFGLNEVQFLHLLSFGFGSSAVALLSDRLHLERQSKEHFRATLANAGEAIVTTDPAGRVVFLNAAAQWLLGITSDEAVGQPIGGVLSLAALPAHRPIEDFFQRALAEDARNRLHRLALLSKTGRRHQVTATLSKMLNRKGEITGCVILFHAEPAAEPPAAGDLAQAPAHLRRLSRDPAQT